LEQPAIVINNDGEVLCANASASKLFDDDFYLRNRRLLATDLRSRIQLEILADQVRALSAKPGRAAIQTVVHRPQRRPIVIKAIVRGLTDTNLLLGVHALLLLTDMDSQPGISPVSLMEIFGLTPAQARLASLLVEGKSLKEISHEMRNSSGTARNHLKAVFTQTGTNRQGELVSLLSRLR
jgi:DNA-binding CsgD family transcriptional regulator